MGKVRNARVEKLQEKGPLGRPLHKRKIILKCILFK
jgi:hypothetical protein